MANIYSSRNVHVVQWLQNVPTPSFTESSCAPFHLDLFRNMAANDPWDWPIDTVIRELCTDQRSWQPRTRNLPDTSALELSIRNHGVDGSTLMVDVDDRALEKDLGILRLGDKAFVRGAIEQFRARSLKYQKWSNDHGPLSAISVRSPTILDTSNFANVSNLRMELAQQYILGTPSVPNKNGSLPHSPADTASPRPLIDAQEPSTPSHKRISSDAAMSDAPPNKRQKLDDAETNGDLVSDVEDTFQEKNLSSEQPDSIYDESIAQPTSTPSQKKIKRLTPTLITSYSDRSQTLEETACIAENDLDRPTNALPGVAFVGDDGRKRMVPVFQTSMVSASEQPYDYGALLDERNSQMQILAVNNSQPAPSDSRKAQNHRKKKSINLAEGYLGKQRIPIEDVFYEGAVLGEELPSVKPTAFWQRQSISSGRRRYVNDAMKHFLQSVPVHFTDRKGAIHSAKLPYSVRLAPKWKKPSFTLISSKGPIARRDLVPNWPEIDPEADPTLQPDQDGPKRANFTFGVEVASQQESFDPESLAKWHHLQGGSEILPLYGDSDDENGYDTDTWESIVEEAEDSSHEKVDEPRTNKFLNLDDVEEAIDDGIDRMVRKWHDKELPRKERREAWRIWRETRAKSSRIVRLKSLHDKLARLDTHRIPQLRNEILLNSYSSRREVIRQTQSMELSINDRESHTWAIGVIKRKIQPDKPAPQEKRAKRTKTILLANDNAEDGESIGSQSDLGDSDSALDDNLDDFVVDDTPSSDEELEMNLADSEMEGNSDSEEEEAGTTMLETSESPSTSKAPILRLKLKSRSGPSESNNSEDDKEMAHRPRIAHSPGSAGPTETLKRSAIATPIKAEATRPRSSAPDAEPAVIDLTALSSDSDHPQPFVIDLTTPQKPRGLVSSTTPSKRPFKLIVNKSSSSSPEVRNFQTPVNNPGDRSLLSEIGSKTPPPYHQPSAISEYTYATWSDLRDRERLLIAVFYNMDREPRRVLMDFASQLSEFQLWESMCQVMGALSESIKTVKGMDTMTFGAIEGFVGLFEMFIDCEYYPDRALPPSKRKIKKIKEAHGEFFARFRLLCTKMESLLQGKPMLISPIKLKLRLSQDTKDRDGELDEDDEDPPRSAQRRCRRPIVESEDNEDPPGSAQRLRRSAITTSEEEEEEFEQSPSSRKTRKRPIVEDEDARDLREQDAKRLAEQEQRRQKIQSDLALMPLDASARKQIIINDAKLEHQGFVYVNDNIAQWIKPHQIDGVRFMWNQIITDAGPPQGCLLAHVMGLGKTMQVITLLEAIVDSSRSEDPSIKAQIPQDLQVSRTLILCPPGLIDNWIDELLRWSPKDSLGPLQKVDSSLKISARLHIIADWHSGSGVLVMGYESFRSLIYNSAKGSSEPPLDEAAHEKIKHQLLSGPNIIVADEAHKLKNPNSQINIAATQFKSMRRIALTGSPLANNVEEYHAMIDWVAPNYLGPPKEFRAKYVEPIQEGLWRDSTSTQRRKALKMLGVLKEDIAPKINRADMTVLRNVMPPKREFVIYVPLTALQTEAYVMYVRSVSSQSTGNVTKDGSIKTAVLWSWLSVLSLLCNHPACYDEKLDERKDVSKKTKQSDTPTSLDNEDDVDANLSVTNAELSPELLNKAKALFQSATSDLKAVDLSNKVKILCQILDASRTAGDKVLVFAQTLPTLNYLEYLCKKQGRKYAKLDGKTQMSKRQINTKDFNTNDLEIYLISTRAGGLGLNLYGANRVVIFDFKFNPVDEEQAIGRAYRIGQTKPVFVYRLVAGGTFEDTVHNKAVFKTQLASRVVDKKNPVAWAKSMVREFLFEPKRLEQEDLAEFRGLDPVLDTILATQPENPTIRSIVQSDTFERDDEDRLTAEEQKEVQQELKNNLLRRKDPNGYAALSAKRQRDEIERLHRAIPTAQLGVWAPNVVPKPMMATNSGPFTGLPGLPYPQVPIAPPYNTPYKLPSNTVSSPTPMNLPPSSQEASKKTMPQVLTSLKDVEGAQKVKLVYSSHFKVSLDSALTSALQQNSNLKPSSSSSTTVASLSREIVEACAKLCKHQKTFTNVVGHAILTLTNNAAIARSLLGHTLDPVAFAQKLPREESEELQALVSSRPEPGSRSVIQSSTAVRGSSSENNQRVCNPPVPPPQTLSSSQDKVAIAAKEPKQVNTSDLSSVAEVHTDDSAKLHNASKSIVEANSQ